MSSTPDYAAGPGLRPIKIGRPGDEIGKKDLLAAARRFQNLHALQLQRIQESLSPRQRDFLDLLPLLFQTNHPMLPGFISTETPAGIPDYTPSRRVLARAERLSKSFEYKRRALQSHPILGIYLMGSVGSIAYSKKSDLDIWLCHESALPEQALDELKRKAAAIEAWAGELQLEAHIFFIDPENFRQGVGQPISTESCGSIQHHLLLEEFYRTSLYIAGRIPGWWLVPPEQDRNYTVYLRHLMDNRFIGEDEVIDFGGMETVSAEEFLGGTLWHLFKAIGAPHKSLLKLLLMESYASEYPTPDWLCTRLKAAVYAGSLDINELDSYLLMYRKAETYLSGRGEYERLDLARQCFYLKINELLSVKSGLASERHYRREILRGLTAAWGWGNAKLQELDGRRRWRVEQAITEQKLINRELMHGYQGVNRFARDYARQMNVKTDEIVLLGRRLYASLEQKPGKVEILSSDGYEELAAQDFSLHCTPFADDDHGWILYTGRVTAADARKGIQLKKSRSLVELLAWLIGNGFYRRHQPMHLETGTSTLTASELKASLDALETFLRRQTGDHGDLQEYAQPARIVSTALFVNLGRDPDARRKDGSQVASDRFDPLSFGADRDNLIRSIDQISLTSWQEMLVNRHEGPSCLFDCLLALLNDGTPVALQCFSFGTSRGRSVTTRVHNLFQALQDHFVRASAPTSRFVLRGGKEFVMFEKRGDTVHYARVPDESALVTELSKPLPRFGTAVFDGSALERSPLPAIYANNRHGIVQLFGLQGPQQTELFVLDERGSLFHRVHPHCNPHMLFTPYALFLSSIQQHFVTPVSGVEYWMLKNMGAGGFEARPFPFKPEAQNRKLVIRIFAQELAPGRTTYSIHCNDKEFSSMESGRAVFGEVAEHILQLRQNGDRYPIYITDLDVPLSILGADAPDRLQTLHLLRYKQKIEDRLNP